LEGWKVERVEMKNEKGEGVKRGVYLLLLFGSREEKERWIKEHGYIILTVISLLNALKWVSKE
jgi:hypothetical protein